MSNNDETNFGTGRNSAYRQSWREVSLRDVLLHIIANYGHVADEDKESVYRGAFCDKVLAGWEFTSATKADQRLILAAVNSAFDNAYLAYLRGLAPPRRRQSALIIRSSQEEEAQPEAESKAGSEVTEQSQAEAAKAEEAQQAEVRQSELARAFTDWTDKKVLDLIMPNGKPFRHNTYEDFDELGGWAHQVRDRLRPGLTPEAVGMTEEQARELM